MIKSIDHNRYKKEEFLKVKNSSENELVKSPAKIPFLSFKSHDVQTILNCNLYLKYIAYHQIALLAQTQFEEVYQPAFLW